MVASEQDTEEREQKVQFIECQLYLMKAVENKHSISSTILKE